MRQSWRSAPASPSRCRQARRSRSAPPIAATSTMRFASPTGARAIGGCAPGEGTRYGTATLVGAIERAAREVADAFPAGLSTSGRRPVEPAWRLASEASQPSRRPGRRSFVLRARRRRADHQSTMAGCASIGFGFATCRAVACSASTKRATGTWCARLVMDDEARVKWLFCSNELKARLLRYAARHERSPQAVVRATWVLHQPSRGDPHDDHFHLRVGCGPRSSKSRLRGASAALALAERPRAQGGQQRERRRERCHLVRWLLAEEHVDQRGDVAWRRLDAAAKPSSIAASLGRSDRGVASVAPQIKTAELLR